MNYKILILMSTNIIFGIGYSMLEILFPLEANKKGTTESTTGIIFSSISIPNIILIPLVPFLSQKLGKKLLFTISIIILIMSNFLFAFAPLFNNKLYFEIFSFFCRFSQGIGFAIAQTMIYSFAVSLSKKKEEINSYMGLMELSWSIGQALGPFYASFLYNFFNFKIPFFILCIFTIISFIFYYKIDMKNSEHDISGFDFIKIIFGNLKIFLTAFSLIIAMACDIFYEPILENYLMKKYNFSTFLVSIYFDIAVVTFFLGIYLINPFLEKYGTKFQISIGLFLMSISLLIIAPIKIFPQNYIVTAIGFICLGFSEAPTIISTMEDFLITLKESEKFSEEYSTDLASAFFTFSVNIGCILGPVIGSYYTEKKSFYYSCIVLSIFCLFWFFVFGIGWFDFIVLDFKNRDNKNYHVVIEEKNEILENIVIESDLVS